MQAGSQTLQFNRFRLEPEHRRLLADGTPVALTSRAYDLLEFLVKNHDRVVTRDEIVAHVWCGLAVGENNLSVQMSLLRRALAEHAGKDPLIINLPGRGYRFVGDVTVPAPVASVTLPEIPAPVSQEEPAGSAPAGRPRRPWRIAGAAALPILALLVGLVTLGALPVWPFLRVATLPDARLSIAVQEFTPVGRDPRTPVLASDYTQATLARFGQFDDIVLFPDHEPVRPKVPPHFRLSGSVQLIGADAVVMATLTEAGTGKLLHRSNVTLPADASIFQQSATAMEMLLDIRPALFQAELAVRRGPARDALDLVIEAHVAGGDLAQSDRTLSLTEQAVRREPMNVPARVFLSTLLTYRMLSSPATAGDEAGRRALHLINSVLLEQPRNFLYIEKRAFTLQALGWLEQAQATTEQGLQIEPACYNLMQTLGEVLMQKGDLAGARSLIKPDRRDLGDNRLATLDFAEGKYAQSASRAHGILAAAAGDWNTQFTALLEVAALSQSGQLAEARKLLEPRMVTLPNDLKRVGAQRQTFYELPDAAWQKFKQGLANAGMPP